MHLNKHESKIYYKKKLRKLRNEARHYPVPVYERNGRLVRIWKGSHVHNRYWFYKRESNRFIRRTSVILHHGQYRKLYDYWWNVD